MRIGSFLFVAVALSAACTATTSADLACQAAGGECLALPDSGGPATGCGEQMAGQPCDPGYVCCTGAPASQPAPQTDAAYGAPTTATDAGTKG
jgi:hypothetical protein